MLPQPKIRHPNTPKPSLRWKEGKKSIFAHIDFQGFKIVVSIRKNEFRMPRVEIALS